MMESTKLLKIRPVFTAAMAVCPLVYKNEFARMTYIIMLLKHIFVRYIWAQIRTFRNFVDAMNNDEQYETIVQLKEQ